MSVATLIIGPQALDTEAVMVFASPRDQSRSTSTLVLSTGSRSS